MSKALYPGHPGEMWNGVRPGEAVAVFTQANHSGIGHFPRDTRGFKLGAPARTRWLWGCESGRVRACFCQTRVCWPLWCVPVPQTLGKAGCTHFAAVEAEAQGGLPRAHSGGSEPSQSQEPRCPPPTPAPGSSFPQGSPGWPPPAGFRLTDDRAGRGGRE